jgi:glycogen(starch) synthase
VEDRGRRLKILFWTDSYYPAIGGVQIAAKRLVPALRERGHEIVVATSHHEANFPDMLVQDGVPIHYFWFLAAMESKNPRWMLRERRRINSFVQQCAPDVVHVCGVGATQLFYLYTRQHYRTPLLVTLQTEDSKMLHQYGHGAMLHRLLESADWVTSVSQIEVERIRERMPQLTGHISCIHNGLREPSLAPAPLPSEPCLICIGRLAPEKSFELAIRAFARVIPSFPNARLVIAGDGQERPLLERLAHALGLAPQVQFTGWVPPAQIPAYINQSCAVVLPSQFEGLPLVGIETAQMARPLIASRVGGLPELVIDGETGLLVPPGDVDALTNAMQTVFTQREYAERMGNAARERVRTMFNFEKIVDAYEDLYSRITTTDSLPRMQTYPVERCA